MSREIDWRWLRPGPERNAARARERRRREAATGATLARARAEGRSLTRGDRDADIRRLWGEGWSGVELAGRFGLSRARVSEICAGLPCRRRYGDPEDVAFPYPRRRAEAPEVPAVRPRPVPPASGETLPPIDARRTGSANGRSKLTEADVARMRELRAEGWTYPALAKEFRISRSNVWYILSGSTWSGPAPEKGVASS